MEHNWIVNIINPIVRDKLDYICMNCNLRGHFHMGEIMVYAAEEYGYLSCRERIIKNIIE